MKQLSHKIFINKKIEKNSFYFFIFLALFATLLISVKVDLAGFVSLIFVALITFYVSYRNKFLAPILYVALAVRLITIYLGDNFINLSIERYILVAPPVTKYNFNFIVPCSASGMIIQGTADDISLEKDTVKIADKLNLREEAEIKYNIVPDADHFFSKHLDEFDRLVDDYIKESMLEDSGKIRKVKRDRRRRRRKKKEVPMTRSEQYRSPIKPLSSL